MIAQLRGPSVCVMSRSGCTAAVLRRGLAVSTEELLAVVRKFNTDYREQPDGRIELKECKLCSKKNRLKADNIWKLSIWTENGGFNCMRCSKGGSWSELQRAVGMVGKYHNSDSQPQKTRPLVGKRDSRTVTIPSGATAEGSRETKEYILPSQELASSYHLDLFPTATDYFSTLDDNAAPHHATMRVTASTDSSLLRRAAVGVIERRVTVLKYMCEERGLEDTVLRRYLVGTAILQFLNDDSSEWVDEVCVTFPWTMPAQHLVPGGGVDDAAGHLESPVNEWNSRRIVRFSNPDDVNNLAPIATSADSRLHYIIRTKFRALQKKGFQRIMPKGGMWGFFGWNTVYAQATSIIITEGEYDAMAVSQALASLPRDDPLATVPAVSLPNGCNSLPPELVDMLAQFERIYLWLDSDPSGRKACEKFVQILGPRRCLVVQPSGNMDTPKDANDALRLDISNSRLSDGSGVQDRVSAEAYPTVIGMLRSARQLTDGKLQSFRDYKAQVLQSARRSSTTVLYLDGADGSMSSSLPSLNALCKGFRCGELVLLSGSTGSGKTTLLSQLCLDFAHQGAPVLWGSLDTKSAQVFQKMFRQFRGSSAATSSADERQEIDGSNSLQYAAEEFEKLPVHLLNFKSTCSSFAEIVDIIQHAVEQHSVRHILLDNLHSVFSSIFLNCRNKYKGGVISFYEMQEMYDAAVEHMQMFAAQHNVNVVMVIPPRKEETNAIIPMAALSGTARLRQAADLVLILQKSSKSAVLQVQKNRFDGSLGAVPIKFDARSERFVEASGKL